MAWNKRSLKQLLAATFETRLTTNHLKSLLFSFSSFVLCWTLYFTAKEYISETLKYSSHQRSWNQSMTSSRGCKLPHLNPFEPEVMKLVKKVDRPKCSGSRIAHVVGGELIIKAKNIRSQILYPIKREPNDDFKTSIRTWLPLTEHKYTAITQGAFGCLTVRIKHVNYIAVVNEDNVVTLEIATCYHGGIFQIVGKDIITIKHVLKHECVRYADDRFTLLDCNKPDVTKFQIRSDKKIKLNGKHVCIDVKDKLFVVGNCSSAVQFKFAEAPTRNVDTKKELRWDAVRLDTLQNDQLITEFHLSAAKKLENPSNQSRKKEDVPLNLIMLMYDSQSGANFDRLLKQTMKTLRGNPTSLQFEGHSIVGDGTTAQLCAMLTGVAEEDLPEARRSFSDAQPVDRWPFIFNDFQKKGYATLFSEDEPEVATFNYRLHGFKNSPTHHYGRPFWLQVESSISHRLCLNDKLLHDYQLEYISSLFKTYKTRPKFGLVITSTLTHNSLNDIQMIDEDLSKFIQDFFTSKMENSVLIIFGDHGLRVGELRNSLQGKLEERLPFFSMTLPSWFPKRFPKKFENAKRNTKVLTSHFDVYHTLMDILGLHPVKRNQTEVGMSLFDTIYQLERPCADVGIKDHWCPCMNLTPMDVKSSFARKLAILALQYINKMLQSNFKSKTKCAHLKLDRILSSAEGKANRKVERFKNTSGNDKCDSCDVEYEDNKIASPSFIYEVVIRVQPSLGIFEASLSLTDKQAIKHIDISRTNLYGNQPHCIQKDLPHLRPYCYCTGR